MTSTLANAWLLQARRNTIAWVVKLLQPDLEVVQIHVDLGWVSAQGKEPIQQLDATQQLRFSACSSAIQQLPVQQPRRPQCSSYQFRGFQQLLRSRHVC